MQFYDVVGNNERIRFNNDISGTYLDDTISSYSDTWRYHFQSIIDNGHAVYFGGGSSSSGGEGNSSTSNGGMGSNPELQSQKATFLNFYQIELMFH